MSIEQVGQATGLTKGFISQLERDMTSASVASLIKMCEALQISVGSLFDPPKTNLVRATERPRINFGGVGVTEYLLTPSGNDRLQVIESYLDPGAGGGDEPYSLNADAEVAHVVRGSVEVVVRGEPHVLHAGDTLTFSGRDPHAWRNASLEEPAQVLWILTPSPW
jgi:transcriptional regulator with XRE-family HTH domain